MKKFTPYTENVIFLDTEFTTLDPYQGEILSLGLVKLNGEELYLELEYEGTVSDWVKEKILPTLNSEKFSREQSMNKIRKFVGAGKPYFISYVTQYDAPYLRKLFNVGDVAGNDNKKFPFHWVSVDFASILFGLGIKPEEFAHNKKEFCDKLGVDMRLYNEHNALDDAKLLRDIYLKMIV